MSLLAHPPRGGAIEWMTRHRVAPNLLMLVLVLGGLFMSTRIRQEVFPPFERDTVTVRVLLPGASPEEAERGLVLAIESAVRGLDGVEQVHATAYEGGAFVIVDLLREADRGKLYQDVQQAVGRITTFPEDALEPIVRLVTHRRDVLDMQLYGDVDAWTLRQAAEQVRDRLLQQDGITQVDLEGTRAFEIHIEVGRSRLREFGLTLDGIAATLRQTALDRGGGSIKSDGGEILLRVQERRDWAREFAEIPLIADRSGVLVRLGDVARVREGFADSSDDATFNGHPAIGVGVLRVGEETPIGVADAVRRALPEIQAELPPALSLEILRDRSEIYQERIELLLKNGFIGLLLVLTILSLFLEFKLAFWVTVGIPTAFLGTLLFLPWTDTSINMVSLFAFILALGIVVDDAIVAGENIYEYRQRGMGNLEAAARGARDIAVPVSFAILTNIVAFLPLYLIPGGWGKIWAVIPVVVATAFVLSWVEALFILPSHLGHTRSGTGQGWLARGQRRFSDGFRDFVRRVYGPLLRMAIRQRYLTVAIMAGVLVVVLAIPFSGRMGFILMPRVEADYASAEAVLPVGSPRADVLAVRDRMVAALDKVIAENGGERLARGVFAWAQPNAVVVRAYLQPYGERPLSTAEVSRLWRLELGQVPGLESLKLASAGGGPGGGASVTVELNHADIDSLERAAATLAARLGEFSSVTDVDDGFVVGKRQFDFRLTEAARSLGLTAADVAAQVRAAFYGAEALKQQRGRNEVTVRVRLPEVERTSEADLERLILQTPDGGEVPLYQVATVSRGRAPEGITRRAGRRTVTVSADVEPIGETSRILAALQQQLLPQLVADYPGLGYSFEGRQADQRAAVDSFLSSVTLALLAIYLLLAIPFRSYAQPIVIMLSIPFGVVGAILGHLIMGYTLSMVSVMGMIALGGVVINDALVMLDYANGLRRQGMGAFEAITEAGIRRFRPIMLTTFTTFGGLAPMIFETSRQARFLIPMALSLGYGILFATAIILLLIPCLYMALEDIRRLARRLGGTPEPAPAEASAPDRLAAE